MDNRKVLNLVSLALLGLSAAMASVSAGLAQSDRPTGSTSPKASEATPNSAPKVKSLSSEEQIKFLQNRLPGNVIGSFGGFASLLFAVENTAIGSSSKEVLHRELHTIYPNKEIYKPTYAEFFDMIARQTGTSFKYEPEVNVWLFDEPEMPLPYTISAAPGWKAENRGMYVAYIPEVAPVGMDIYMMGRYSDISGEGIKKVRDSAALMFSKHINAKITTKEMRPATVDGADALYFESAGPAADRYWRQWAFYKNGQLFVIVSAYNQENKDKIVSDVDAMIKSFHVL